MRKKFYILIISIISLIIITTAFIPIQSQDGKIPKNNNENKTVIHDGPEAGYIEEIEG